MQNIDAAAVAGRLAGAIRCRTIAYAEQEKIDGSQFFALHEHLKKSYPRVASELTWEVVADYSLLLTWRGRGGDKPLAVLAHMDVVPVSPGTEQDWAHPPFEGVFDGERVWGRGALDMKNQLISMLEAAEGLLAEGFTPASDVYLCFGHNEEIVCAPKSGARAIMEVLKSRGVMLETVVDEGGAVTDGSMLLGSPGIVALLGTCEKGYMDVRLTCDTAGGHSSQPPAATAIGILSKAVTKLESHPFPTRLTSTVLDMFRQAGASMPFAKRLVMKNLWLFAPVLRKALTKKPMTNAMVRTTTAATMASGSPAPNVLPQHAEIVVNVRLLPGDSMESALDRMKRVVGDDRVSVELIRGRNASSETSIDSHGYRVVKEVLSGLYPGVAVLPYLMVGGTDSINYDPVCRSIIRTEPYYLDDEALKTVHGTNECISADNLVKGVSFFRELIARF